MRLNNCSKSGFVVAVFMLATAASRSSSDCNTFLSKSVIGPRYPLLDGKQCNLKSGPVRKIMADAEALPEREYPAVSRHRMRRNTYGRAPGEHRRRRGADRHRRAG